MLWLLVFAIPLAFLLRACVVIIPDNQRRVSPRLGFLFIVPAVLGLVTLIPFSALSFFIVAAGALAVYYFIRLVAVMGLDATYRIFSQTYNMTLSPLHTYLAWLLGFVEPLLMLALFVYAFLTNTPGNPLTRRGMGEVIQIVAIVVASGLGLSYLFFIGMLSNRNRVAQRAPQLKGSTQKKIAPSATKTNVPPPPKKPGPVKK